MPQHLLLATLLLAVPTPALAQSASVTFQLLNTVQTPSLGTGPLALSLDGQKVAVLRLDRARGDRATLVLSDTRTGRELWRLATPNAYEGALAFSPDGQTLVNVGSDVQAYEVAMGEAQWTYSSSDAVPSSPAVVFSPDGQSVYLAHLDTVGNRHLIRSDTRTGKAAWDAFSISSVSKEPSREESFYGRILSLAVHPSGKLLASGSFSGGIVLWNAETGEQTGTLTDKPLPSKRATQAALAGKTAHGGRVTALAFALDGTLVSGANDGTVKLWNPKTGQKLAEAPLPDGVQAMTLLPGGKGVLVASGRNAVQLSLPDLERERVFVGHAEKVISLALSGDTLWTSSADGTVKRWNLKSGVDEATYGTVKTAAVSPDGQTYALNLGDTTVRLTDASGNTLKTLRGFLPPKAHFDSIGGRSLAFSPDGQTLAGGLFTLFHMTVERYAADSNVYLWDVAGGKLQRRLADLPGDDLAFSPDGQQLLGVNKEQGHVPAYGVRRVADGKVIATPCQPYLPNGRLTGVQCPPEDVRGVSWVGNRAYKLTLGQSGGQQSSPAFVRDVLTGQVRVPLGKLWNNGPVMGLSPDGRRVVSLAGNGLRLWDGKTGKPLGIFPEFVNPSPYRGGPILFSPDGKTLTYPGPDLRLHDTATGKLLGEQKGAGEAVGFIQRGQALVTLNEQGVQLWRIREGK